MVADVAEPISVRVGLARVRVVRTIVRGIWNAVAVTVGVTGVADPIAVDVARRDGCIRVANVVGLVLPAGRILARSRPKQRKVDVPASRRGGTSGRDVRDHARRARVVTVPAGVVIVVAEAPPFVVAAAGRGVRVPHEHVALARPVGDFQASVAVDIARCGYTGQPAAGEFREIGGFGAAWAEGVQQVEARAGDDLAVVRAADVSDRGRGEYLIVIHRARPAGEIGARRGIPALNHVLKRDVLADQQKVYQLLDRDSSLD